MFISKTILDACSHRNLNMNKCVGQGYDNCATMADHISGIQKKIKDMYSRAHFFSLSKSPPLFKYQWFKCLDWNQIRTCKKLYKQNERYFNIFKESPVGMNVISSSNCKLIKLCETRFVKIIRI